MQTHRFSLSGKPIKLRVDATGNIHSISLGRTRLYQDRIVVKFAQQRLVLRDAGVAELHGHPLHHSNATALCTFGDAEGPYQHVLVHQCGVFWPTGLEAAIGIMEHRLPHQRQAMHHHCNRLFWMLCCYAAASHETRMWWCVRAECQATCVVRFAEPFWRFVVQHL